MGQERIDRDGLQRVSRIGKLLDQANAIDDDARLDMSEEIDHDIVMFDIYPRYEPFADFRRKKMGRIIGAYCAVNLPIWFFAQNADHCVSEHAARTEHK